jgi:biopolymer transport protein ExbB
MQEMGLAYAWQQADYVSRSIAIILILMSALSWGVMLFKVIHLLRLNASKRRGMRFWHANSFSEGLEALGAAPCNPFLDLAAAGLAADEHHNQRSSELHQRFDPSDWLARCLKEVLDEHVARLQSGLAVLASIGSTSPFVGLFGTVWGIYHALKTIGLSGEASLAQVAGPVGESLIMTAFGLFVAIPAVLGYNALARQNKALVHQMSRFANDLHAFFLTGARLNIAQGLASGQKPSAEAAMVQLALKKAGEGR